MVEKFLEGLSWGVLLVGAMLPLATFSVVWTWLGPRLKKPEKPEGMDMLEKMFKEPSLMSEHEPPPHYKYIASTIVRPPAVMQLEDVKESNEEEDDE